MDPHRLAELRSLAYHRAIARRLAAEPALVEGARARVERWHGKATTHPHYAAFWAGILARPPAEVAAAIVEPGEEMTAARQASPFAGALSSRERWRIWREVRATR